MTSISLTEKATLAALRSVLLGILPAGLEVIRTEINRVPQPSAPDFVLLTPISRIRLATNIDTWTDAPEATPPIGTRDSLAATEVIVQVDVHGPSSADNAQIISTVLRDEYATIAFTRLGVEVQPLYAEDPRQSPFENGEQQTEWRWTVDVHLQANPVVTTPQDFADVVEVTTYEADIVEVDTIPSA
jgi:hypothetical protein